MFVLLLHNTNIYTYEHKEQRKLICEKETILEITFS